MIKNKSARGLSGRQVIDIIRGGGQLECPICHVLLETVPQYWKSGLPLHGIVCPNNLEHFYIHIEDAETMRKMREKMKDI